MSEHTWSEENLTGYAAGGLTPDERERFERHAAACGDCAAALAEWRVMEEKLDTLFADVRPQAGLEDRMIEVLRKAPLPRRFWRSTFARFAMSAAAVVMLGFIGAGLSVLAERVELPFPGELGEWAWNGRTKSENNLKQAPISLRVDSSATHSRRANDAGGEGKDGRWYDGGVFNGRIVDGENATMMLGDIKARPGVDQPADSRSGTRLSGLGANGTHSPALGFRVQTRVEGLDRLGRELGRSGANKDSADKLADLGDTSGSLRTDRAQEYSPGPLTTFGRAPAGGRSGGQELRLEERLGEADRVLNEQWGARAPSNQPVDGIPPSRKPASPVQDSPPSDSTFSLGFRNAGVTTPAPARGMAAGMAAGKAVAPGASTPTDFGYFAGKFADNDIDKKSGKRVLEQERLQEKQRLKDEHKVEHRLGAIAMQGKPEPGQPPKSDTTRKIIRTGDIEFEVDSFDKAVERINNLIDATKGAFVATTNSDKLPNGKVKGSVVVRMPPERLDKFLLDLRKDLGKIGDLKSQRIGSQDITKQYTDIESRLKAAKTMEERLLNIIKSGKGEIKDLVAAERELGNWRTKIEEMEGEIRYYNNQIGLSTLTISLYEKEIRAPSALVVTERVTMRIETEDVEKSQQSALKAVAEAKGRVTKSELKQHAAGQLEAIVQAEVAPAAAANLRTAFKLLGIVTKLDSDRLQQAEGGSGNLLDVKTRQNDVQFFLTLYNVANIQPRETFNVQVATLDVPAGFRKLQDVVTKAKGQIRKGQLNEQDKLNISAEFDFDVPSPERKNIDKALEEAGRILSRSTAQAPPGDTVTDSKVGYRLVLRSVSGIPARERVTLAIEVRNAKEVAAEFKELVRAQKGMVQADRSKKEPDGTVTAILLFDVPLPAKDDLVKKFEAAGNVKIEQNTENAQVPNNDLATAHIDVTLSSTGPIVPSDKGLWPQIRTSLTYSFTVLSWSVMFIILGLCVVVPWALLIWGGYRLVKRMRRA